MARQAVVQSEPPDDPRERDAALRPRWLREVIGQKAVVQRLGIVINEAEVKRHPFEQELPQRVFYTDGSVGDW